MDSNTYCGSSKQRRDMLKEATDKLGLELPFDYGKQAGAKISQLRILKAACSYLKKEKYFAKLRSFIKQQNGVDSLNNWENAIKSEVKKNSQTT